MTKYTAEQVIKAADKLRTVMDILDCEMAPCPYDIRFPSDLQLVVYNVMPANPSQVAHELIGLGMVALAEHGHQSIIRTTAHNGIIPWQYYISYVDADDVPQITSNYPAPLAAVVAACVGVLPRLEEEQ